MDAEIASLLLLCDMLDTCDRMKKGFGTNEAAQELRTIMEKHLAGFKVCYGMDALLPKNHYSLHIPEQYEENEDTWFDCWPQERKHRIVLRKARHAFNTRTFEKTCIARLWLETHRVWTGNDMDTRLRLCDWTSAGLPDRGQSTGCRRGGCGGQCAVCRYDLQGG